MRNRGLSPNDKEVTDTFDKLGSLPVSPRSPKERVEDLEDVLNWTRNKGVDDETNDSTGEFRKLDSMLPRKPGQSPEDRARDIEAALDWVREQGDSPSEDRLLEKPEQVPISQRSPEEREQDVDDALNWLRNKGKDDKKNDPTGDFRKLDSMLPKKRGQSP